jgi:hypothetical protein
MRYPHFVQIFRPEGDVYNPFAKPEEIVFEPIYEGICRCDMGIRTRLRAKSVMDADYEIYIPNPNMPYVSERDEVKVVFPNAPDERVLEGTVKDFLRYDRNCIVYFNIIKETKSEIE